MGCGSKSDCNCGCSARRAPATKEPKNDTGDSLVNQIFGSALKIAESRLGGNKMDEKPPDVKQAESANWKPFAYIGGALVAVVLVIVLFKK